jgi:IS30 family transposase
MGYQHLSLAERERLYALREQGKSFREIAKRLGRHHTSLSREYRRHAKYYKSYLPCKAEKEAIKIARAQRQKAPLKNPTVFLYVRIKLREEKWSPETIAGRLSIDFPGQSITPETIYQYIYGKGKRYKLWQYLPRSHKKRKVKKGRGVRKDKSKSLLPEAVSIEKRPQKITERAQVGHLETDLMEGKKTDKTCLSVEVERKTRYILLTKLRNKRTRTKSKRLQKKLKKVKSLSKTRRPLVKTMTMDNGAENKKLPRALRRLGVKSYSCHPYHAWEKGTVENTISLIRRYIPKGMPISHYSKEQIQWLENKLNRTPRKCLGFLTPNEVMEKEANTYKFRKYKEELKTRWCTST